MKKTRCLAAIVTLAALWGSLPHASAGLLVSDTRAGFGYGTSNWTTMTGYLDSAFGGAGNIATVYDLANQSQVLAADALWIDVRTLGISSQMTTTEKTNVADFIATGKRVVMIGDNNYWAGWNNDILGLVGSSYPGGFFGGDTYSGDTSPVVANDLTAGVSQISVSGGGVAPAGTPLFDQNVATLWGAGNNVLTILDFSLFSDSHIADADNDQFARNTAAWIASSPRPVVPEPASLVLMTLGGVGLLGGAARNRRKNRQA